MKSFLIIGLGRFGTHLCKDLSKLDNEQKLATAPMKKYLPL